MKANQPIVFDLRCEKQFYYLEFAVNFFPVQPHRAPYISLQYIALLSRVQVELDFSPSITDGVYRNENFVEIIPVFSTFSNF